MVYSKDTCTRMNTETQYVIAKGQNQHNYSSIGTRYVKLLYIHTKVFKSVVNYIYTC